MLSSCSVLAVVIASPQTGKGRIERPGSGVVVMGGEARCNIVLSGRGVSGTHCRLSPMPELPGAYLLEDLASTYGTFVNNARVVRPVVVSSRDVISVGEHRLMLAQPGQEQACIDRLSQVATPESAQRSAAPKPADRAVFDARAPWPQQFEYFDGLARTWHEAGRPKSRLLTGATLRFAQRWLAAGAGQSPTPDALHRDFVERSRNRRLMRLQLTIALAVVGLLLVAGGGAAYLFRAELQTMFVPPESLAESSDDPGTDEPILEQGGSLAELAQVVEAEPDDSRQLLLQSALADVSRSRGRPLLSDAGWSFLNTAHSMLAKRRETVLRGHTAPVTGVAFAPEGRRVVSVSEDGSARLWDFSTASPTRSVALRGHMGTVTTLAISPDGRRLATGGEDGVVYVWPLDHPDPATQGVALERHESSIRSLRWHPSGAWIVSGDDAGVVVSWPRADEQHPPFVRAAHEGPITALAWGPTASPTLWSGSDDRIIREWSMQSDGRLVPGRTLDDLLGGVTAVSVSEDGRWLGAGTTSGEVTLWRLKTKRRRRSPRRNGPMPLPAVPLEGHRDSVSAVAFTADARWFVSAGGGQLRMWDLSARDPGVTTVVLPGHTGDINAMALTSGQRAVTAATDNQLRVWDLEKSREVISARILEGHDASVSTVAVSADGARLASGAADGTVRIWDAFAASEGRGGTTLRVSGAAVQDVAVSESGHVLGVSSGQSKVWDLADRGRWRDAAVLSADDELFSAGTIDETGQRVVLGTETGTVVVWALGSDTPTRLEGHTGTVNALSLSPDGRRLVSISSDRSVRVWDLERGQAIATWEGHSDEVHALAVSRAFVFTGGLDGTLIRWSWADGTPVVMPGHEAEILKLEVSSDGALLASTSVDRRVRLWDAEEAKAQIVFRGHDEAVNAVAFGGRRWLATGGADRRILVWDLSSEHPDEAPRTLLGHEQSITSLVFTRDLDVLASASNDQTVRLWRLDTDRQLVLRGHAGVVAELRVTRDGMSLISAGFDGTIRAWPLAYETFARVVCDVVGESLPDGYAAAAFGVPVAEPCAR